MSTPEDEYGTDALPATYAADDTEDLETLDVTQQGPAAWPAPPAPPAPPSNRPARRLAAIVAIIALVLASAGIGAAVATAFDRKSQSFSTVLPDSALNGTSNGSSASSSSDIDVNSIADSVTPSVVNIFTTIGDNAGEAAGTGIVVTSNGKVLTNNHVIENASEIRVQIGGRGSMHEATTIGYDKADDVALLQIKDVSGLKAAKIGDVSEVEAGDPIVAIGNAQGRGGTPEVVSGEVAALNQSVTAGDGRGDAETLHGMIQVEAAIRSGDSGGPLINADGEVIGVNTAASVGRFQMQSSTRVAFAIPIDKAMSVAKQINSGDETDGVHVGPRGLLGVQVERDLSDSGLPFSGDGSGSDSSGAVVVEVQNDSPADDAGISAGDVIVSVDGKNVDTGSELIEALAGSHPKDNVKVTWVDESGDEHSATVRLASGPPA
jgi:S1-C subfamily serine protease